MSPDAALLTLLVEKAAGLVSSLVAGAPAEEMRIQHERAVSDAIKRWQIQTGATEPPLPFDPSPSEPPRTEG